MQYNSQPPRRPPNGHRRPMAQGAPNPRANPQNPPRVRRDATQDYARRKAAYERQMAEKRRREAQRKRKVQIFWGRVLVFFVILLLLPSV